MMDNYQPDNPNNQPDLCKGDVPFPFAGKVTFYWMILAVISIVIAAFFTPDGRDARPGILDGIVGIILGMSLGSLSFRLTKPYLTGYYTIWRDNGYFAVRWSPEGLLFGAMFAIGFLGSTIAVVISAAIAHKYGLKWPLVACSPISGFSAFAITWPYLHFKWYETLPD